MNASGQGRKRKPNEIRALEYGTGGKDAVKCQASTIPKPPEWITSNKYAKAEFERLKPFMNTYNIVMEQDFSMFFAMCESYGLWRETMDFLKENGLTYQSADLVKKRPEVDVARQYKKEFMDLARDFGLTPCARARLDMDVRKFSDDPLERLLND